MISIRDLAASLLLLLLQLVVTHRAHLQVMAATSSSLAWSAPTPHPSGFQMPTPHPSALDLRPTPRPTPMSTGFIRPPAPTPAPTTTTALPLDDYSRFPRTEIHVLEKCCPYVSHYALRHYPSSMEDDGWVPGLTFHAFTFHKSLRNCWRIVTATTTGSHIWERITPGDTPVDTAHAFCLPATLPDRHNSVFYVSTADNHASFITQPLRSVSQSFFDTFSIAGWDTARFQEIHPLAYYYWRPLMPLRLITDIRMHVTVPKHSTAAKCPTGFEIVPGDFNHNFALDPFVAFCVKYGHTTVLNPYLNLTVKDTDATFVTKLLIRSMTVQQLMDRHNNKTRDSLDCVPPWERIQTTAESWRPHQQGGVSPQRDALFARLHQAALGSNLTEEYSVFTGVGEWLTFCVSKAPLVLPGGKMQESSAFIERLVVDSTQIARKNRLQAVFNSDEDLTKSKPLPQDGHGGSGRINYDREHEKELMLMEEKVEGEEEEQRQRGEEHRQRGEEQRQRGEELRQRREEQRQRQEELRQDEEKRTTIGFDEL